MDLVHLPEWILDRKRISETLALTLALTPTSPNPKAQKRLGKTK